MIQLANDPNASRMGWRPAQSENKVRNLEHPRSHVWPFLSRQSGRTAPPTASRTTSSDSVS